MRFNSGAYWPQIHRITLPDTCQYACADTHERTHSLQGNPQYAAIEYLESQFGTDMYYNRMTKPHEYLDKPNEIYARLMQFRKLHDIDPLEEISIESIEEFRKKGLLSYFYLDRYSDSFLYNLFNPIAKNNNTTQQQNGLA